MKKFLLILISCFTLFAMEGSSQKGLEVAGGQLGVQGEQKDMCAICLQELGKEGLKQLYDCHHQFHRECAEKWRRTCPICRKKKKEILNQLQLIQVNQQLIEAAHNGHLVIVERLLQVPGINVNAANNNGYTALMLADFNGRSAIVERLRAAGAE